MLGNCIRERYRIESRLGQGGWSEVYGATDLKTNCRVVIKIHRPAEGAPDTALVLRYQREALTLLELRHEHIVRLLDFGEDGGTFFMVMEHDNGISLFQYLRTCEWPTLSEVVRLMTQLTSALRYVHEKGIVHQDIKPSNIILRERQIDHGKLADFGCVLLKHVLREEGRHTIMGTIPYISPEQLRSSLSEVDPRSDLYALGVTFYELLSGAAPKTSTKTPFDVKEGPIRKVPPPSFHNPLVPEVLDRIAMKLISLSPENRYQSAASLLDDLTEYQEQSVSKRGFAFFQVGRTDDKYDLTFDQRLVGREQEIDVFRGRLRDLNEDRGSIVMVSGEAGSGKSRLLEELRILSHPTETVNLFAKSSDNVANYPYYPLIHIFQDYMEYVQSRPADAAVVHHRLIREHFSDYAVEIAGIGPAMGKYLDVGRKAAIDDPTTRLPLFLESIGRFFVAAAEATRPMVLVFDDIHWADPATLQLLKTIAPIVVKGSRVMIVGAYRSEEVADRPALRAFLNHFEQGNIDVTRLRVAPLTPPLVRAFVGRLVPESTEGFRDVLQILMDFSRGNPLFIIEMIRSLIDDQVIHRADGQWQIVKDRISSRVLGLSLAQLILGRTRHLSPETNIILTTASCIGRTFSRGLLYQIAGTSRNQVDIGLEEAVRTRLVIRRSVSGNDEFAFSHDKIYETFYHSLPPMRQQELHLQIARHLEGQHRADPNKIVYALAYHYLHGKNDQKAFDYAVRAGYMARKSLAMLQAVEFFQGALDLLEVLPEMQDKESELRDQIADALSIIGQYDRAIENYNKVMATVSDRARLAVLERKIGNVHFRRGEMPEAIEHFKAGLNYLKGGMASSPRFSKIVGFTYLLRIMVSRFIPRFLLLGRFRNKREELRELINLYQQASLALFWVDVNYGFETHVKCMYHATLLGKSAELARAYDQSTAVWMKVSMPWVGFRSLAKSRKICDEIHDRFALGNNLCFTGLALQWCGRNREAIAKLLEAAEIHNEIGALAELELDYVTLGISYRYLGEMNKFCEYVMKEMEIAEKVNDYRGLGDAYRDMARYFHYIGNHEEAKRSINLVFQKIDKTKNPLLFAIASRVLGEIMITDGKLDRAIELMEEAERLQEGRWFLGEYIIETYVSLGEAYVQKIEGEPTIDSAHKEKLLTRIANLQKFAQKSAKQHRNYQGTSLRLKALLMKLNNRRNDAEKYFQQAIKVLEEGELKYQLAKTLKAYAQFLESADADRALELDQRAQAIFRECNALGALDDRYDDAGFASPDGLRRVTSRLRTAEVADRSSSPPLRLARQEFPQDDMPE